MDPADPQLTCTIFYVYIASCTYSTDHGAELLQTEAEENGKELPSLFPQLPKLAPKKD